MRAYRWGEDGLLGFCDRECRLCFSLALWNGKDERLKERLFGLTGNQGNHGEDCKELCKIIASPQGQPLPQMLFEKLDGSAPGQFSGGFIVAGRRIVVKPVVSTGINMSLVIYVVLLESLFVIGPTSVYSLV